MHWGRWWKGGKTPIKLEYSQGPKPGVIWGAWEVLRTTFQMTVGRAFESHIRKAKRESKRTVSPVWKKSSIWWCPSLLQVLLRCLLTLYYVKLSLSKSSSGPPAHTPTPSLYFSHSDLFSLLELFIMSSPSHPVPHYFSSKFTHILIFSDNTWAGRPLLTLSLDYLLHCTIPLLL